MAEAILETQVCSKCGADVREGSSFCYACGTNVVVADSPGDSLERGRELELPSPKPESDLGDNGPGKTETPNKLATAAAERRKSRSGRRKPKEVVWEEPDERSDRTFVLVTLLIFLATVTVVIFTVLIK